MKMVPVTVRFTAEQLREIDLRAESFQLDRADVIRMETLKGLGWVEKKRAEQEKRAMTAKMLDAS